jgi:ABC-type Fe3+-hydroxamate transport system substrate-binding protein
MKKKLSNDTHHLSDPLLTTIQEVYFDMCDALNNGSLVFNEEADTPEEFEDAQEWLAEQKRKLEEIESQVKELLAS